MALLAEHLAAFISLIAGAVRPTATALINNSMESIEFLRLKRELQQIVPIPQLFSHIDRLLSLMSPIQFQKAFTEHIVHTSSLEYFDSGLLAKLSAYIFKKFDKIYSGEKYAFEDEFLDFFSASSSCKDGKCDRFYEIDQDQFIHIRCSESLISEGTTGYSLWEASVALLASLTDPINKFKYIEYFRNKRVLELGSGTGLGGLAIAALASPRCVLLSDVSQVHDSYTYPNILLNTEFNVSTNVIYWNDLALASEAEGYACQFDTIVGCDLVYDPEVCSLLFSASKALLSAKNSSINQIILFCTLRNPQTYDDFVKDLKNEANLSVSIEELSYDVDADINNNPIILNSIESFRILIINKQL